MEGVRGPGVHLEGQWVHLEGVRGHGEGVSVPGGSFGGSHSLENLKAPDKFTPTNTIPPYSETILHVCALFDNENLDRDSLRPNVLQNLPILFCIAYYFYLLLPFLLPLFPYINPIIPT